MTFTIPESVDETNVTEKIIEHLVSCPKTISNKKRVTPVDKGKFIEYKYSLISLDAKYEFSARIMEHKEIENRFSVILIYIDKTKRDVVLYRCNGPHSGDNLHDPVHFKFHSHQISVENWRDGVLHNAYKKCDENYSSISGAIDHFLSFCRIIDERNIMHNRYDNSVGSENQSDKIYSGQISIDDFGDRNE